VLDASKHLITDRWLDQPDAHEQIEHRRASGALSEDEAARLHHFVDHGFLTMSIDVDEAFAAAFEADIERLWLERPVDLAISPRSGSPMSMHDYEGAVREPGYRIPDLHSHSARALDLYLHPGIFRMVELILDEDAVAFQSLYFEYGSSQGLHRDPMFVRTRPLGHMVASWVALEDITPESGPLAYVPGSHRFPWYEFAPDTVEADADKGKRFAFQNQLREQLRERDLEPQAFTCNRGDVFLWHAGLVHGGRPVEVPEQTRKSYVTHYSTAANYHSRQASMKVRRGDTWRNVSQRTEEVVRRPNSRGLASPLAGVAMPEPSRAPAPTAPARPRTPSFTRRVRRALRARLGSRGHGKTPPA
jgi:hypothetical protein